MLDESLLKFILILPYKSLLVYEVFEILKLYWALRYLRAFLTDVKTLDIIPLVATNKRLSLRTVPASKFVENWQVN